jgi:3-oxoacyl-[acyl-carrier-protein] synthase III
MTGVETRYWVDDSTTTGDLCFEATRTLLDRIGWGAASVDALIFVSQTPDQRLPPTSCTLQARLGLSTHCQAFDVSLGCSGYVYGLWLSAALINAGCGRILLLAGDTTSQMLNGQDRGTALLFGDAGTATALERKDGAPPLHFALGTDGRGAQNLIVRGGGFRERSFSDDTLYQAGASYLFMDGSEVFTFTLRAVPKLVREVLAAAGRGVDEIDAFLLHQANRFMLTHLQKKIGIPLDRLPINIDRYGNTSSASIPLLLTTNLASRIVSERLRLMLVGFGVGYSWGAAHLDAEPLGCAETIFA